MNEKLLRMAEKHALEQILSEFPKDLEYNIILERIGNDEMFDVEGDEDIIIWDVFEGYDPAQVVEVIENAKDAAVRLIEAVLEKPE